MPDANSIVTGKIVTKQVIRCRFHDKQNRYELYYYEEDGILIYRCLLCPKGEHLMRYEMPKKEKTDAPRSIRS